MRKYLHICLLPFLIAGCAEDTIQGRLTKNFDDDWLFTLHDKVGYEDPVLNDSSWEKIDVPHDWSITDIQGTNSPFDSAVNHGVACGFTRGGTGWYRKHFNLPESAKNKCIFICFGGVYKNSDIWINGSHLGNHFYGYTHFEYELTDKVHFDRDNVIAVQVKNSSVTCRWYSGSGIYRHVWLKTTNPLHFASNGIYITTPEVSDEQAEVKVVTTIINQSDKNQDALIKLRIINEKNETVAKNKKDFTITPDEVLHLNQSLAISDPDLWDLETPYLYQLEAEILVNNRQIDIIQQDFGIRTISCDTQKGFSLNGKTVYLKGGCFHHDNGPLGVCAYDRAEVRKVKLLKDAGYNAIRFAHNPPSNAILDACDRLGMLAIDEAFDVWNTQHFDNDYASVFPRQWKSDLEAMILRDRNHPSVIMWSIGNEIRQTETPEVVSICNSLSTFVQNLDPTRPVTSGVNKISDAKAVFLSHLDVCGYNYSRGRYVSDHERHPDRIMYGSESYAIQAYDYWQDVLDYPWVIGDFVWTAFDYIGEASIGWRGYPQNQNFYPWNLAYCGDIDICGIQRPQSYYRQTLWNNEPVVKVFVTPPVPTFPLNPDKASWSIWDWEDVIASWNFEGFETKDLKVSIYTNCDEIELLLNGTSLGKKQNKDKNMLSWGVPYKAGELKAVAYNQGLKVDSSVLTTASEPIGILLEADRESLIPNGQDLSYIDVKLIDEQGVLNPSAENIITFTISGPGKIAAVGSSNPTSIESFNLPYRKVWQGRCQLIVQSEKQKGEIRLTAESEGLQSQVITLNVE